MAWKFESSFGIYGELFTSCPPGRALYLKSWALLKSSFGTDSPESLPRCRANAKPAFAVHRARGIANAIHFSITIPGIGLRRLACSGKGTGSLLYRNNNAGESRPRNFTGMIFHGSLARTSTVSIFIYENVSPRRYLRAIALPVLPRRFISICRQTNSRYFNSMQTLLSFRR